MIRKLIVNGDDLGYTQGVNRAMAECLTDGILGSSTLMANGGAFEDAVAMLKRHDRLDVGVHLVLSELDPLAGAEAVPGLVDGRGLLLPSPAALAHSLFRKKANRRTIRMELELQLAKVVDHGLRPTHLDSHKHVHILPPVLDVMIELAKKHAIPWIRNPFDDISSFGLLSCLRGPDRTTFARQHFEARLAWAMKPHFLRSIRRAGLRTPDHFLGVSLTGLWNEAAAYQALNHLPQGTSEWMVHPGRCDEDLRKSKTRLLEQRERERELLTSPRLRAFLREQKIDLVTFGETAA